MKHFLFFFAWFAPIAAFGQTQAEFSVRGWSGEKILVERNERGQHEVDGTFVDYSVSILEVYDHKTREVTQRYSLEKPIGTPPALYLNARAVDKSPPIKNAAKSGETSPSGNYLIVPIRRTEQRKTDSNQTQCNVEERLQLFNNAEQKVFVLSHLKSAGQPVSKRVAECPRTKTQVYWSEDEQRAVVIRSRGARVDVRPVDLTDLTAFADAAYLPFRTSISKDGRLKTSKTWQTVFHGPYRTVESELQNPTDFMDRVAVSLVTAVNPKTRGQARKQVDKALKQNKPTTTWKRAMRAAIYRASGDTVRSQKELDRVLKTKPHYQALVELADFFYAIDLDIAAQLYVHALSTDEARQDGFDTQYGYAMLLRALLDAGDIEQAKDVLEQFDEYQGAVALQVARYETLRREPTAFNVVNDAIFDQPGHCDAYLYAGRAAGQKNTKTALNYFRAAVACDPNLPEALFLLADLEERRGNRARSQSLYAKYRKIALPRQSDDIRDARRQHAYNRTVGAKTE